MPMSSSIYQVVMKMSDFLKKFSDDSYKKVKKIDYTQEEEIIQINEEPITVDIKQETQLETIPKDVALETIQPSKEDKATFQTSNVREEVYIRDDEVIKKRKRNIIIAVVSVLLILMVGVFGYRKLSEVRVPQFVKEKTLNDVQVWAAKNKIEMDYTSAFNTKVSDGYIVKQSVKSGETIQKGSNFEVVLSKGANPEAHIVVPKFMEMTLTEVEAWKQKEKATNVMIEKVFSDDVEKSKVIRFEFKTEGIDESNYRRKDKINVVVSKGKEVYEKNIDMPDFKEKSKAEVEAWAKENDITIEFSEEANSKVMEGNVITQGIAPKTKVAKKDSIGIVVSRGKISIVPNFAGLDEAMGQIEATKASVTTTIIKYYSNSVQASYLISQSLPVGTEIKEQSIALIYSLGKPYIGNFDGEDVFSIVQSIDEMNGKGAALTYEIVEVSSSEKKGSIITTNYKANFVSVGSHVVISVSSGS